MRHRLHFTNIDFVYNDSDDVRATKEYNTPIKCSTYSESSDYETSNQLYDDLRFAIKQLENVKVVRRHTNVFNENASSRAITMTINEIMIYMRNHNSITFVNIGKYTEYFIIVKIKIENILD